jgi:uncharacterized protein (TIGR03435 family)
MPNGAYSATKVQVIALLTSAFGVSVDRLIGAPRQTERYDIEARYEPPDPNAPVPSVNVLLQSLLRDRFGLVAHMEKRDSPAYVLKLALNDERLGPGLKPSTVNCADTAALNGLRERNAKAANGAPACGAIEGPDTFNAGGTTMDILARALRIPSGRTVINGTGLAGTWDVTLQFAPLNDTSGEKPNAFTALQEQLGLKLQSTKRPVDVLVIDHVERPTED